MGSPRIPLRTKQPSDKVSVWAGIKEDHLESGEPDVSPREYVTSKTAVGRVNIERIERAFISRRSRTGLRMIDDDDAPPELDV